MEGNIPRVFEGQETEEPHESQDARQSTDCFHLGEYLLHLRFKVLVSTLLEDLHHNGYEDPTIRYNHSPCK